MNEAIAEISNLGPGDVDACVDLQRVCFPAPFPETALWTRMQLMRHLDVFPEGQFVARAAGTIVGSASAVVVSEPLYNAHLPWQETVGGHEFENHDPGGTTLYGADISVHPDYRRKGVGRALYGARIDQARQQGLIRVATACRIPDFARWRATNGGTSHDYAQSVVGGTAVDRTLTPLLRYGLRFVAVIENYMDDEESGNAAALLELML